jgi:mitochondrial intermediate peptidase
MQKALRKTPWTCARCLHKQKRYQSTTTATLPAATRDQDHDRLFLHAHGTKSFRADEQLLRNVFNSKAFWRDFAQTAKGSSGLIGNKFLTSPKGFQEFAETSLRRCKRLVEKTLAASTVEEYRAIPRDLDRLSDLLCRVIDLSDFVRSIHPDHNIQSAATESYSLMFQYMNELNTTTGLNKQLKKAFEMPEVTSQWTEEEKMVGIILMKDFAKSGIDLPEAQRQQFVDINNDIAQVGTDFVNGMEPARKTVSLSKNQLDGLDPSMVGQLSRLRRPAVPVYSQMGRLVLSTAHDAEARKEMYTAERTASVKTISRLEELLLRRAKLAELTGYASFGQMTLVDKMSKTPEAVNNFLQSLNASNQGQTLKELDQILAVKQTVEPGATRVEPWDHAYLVNRLQQSRNTSLQRTSRSRLHSGLSAYFSLGNVMTGLSKLFQSLYGIRLVPQASKLGETWNSEVRRLDAITESGEHIATIYCDLFARPGKSPNPAHYTLVCSREISKLEIQENMEENQPLNDGVSTTTTINPLTGRMSTYQIPVIALVCDFPPPSPHSHSEPTLLSMYNVTTLFHEMGHAVHSVLGRTSMQGLAGTRCATDFAELPSVLMEYFATNGAVLRQFARHWETDDIIPQEMIDAIEKEQGERAKRTGGWDNENQILMALLDQQYHSADVVAALRNGSYDSTKVYHDIWSRYGSISEPKGTAWQGFFGHLYGYGATYYAYLFDRAIARQVWRVVFSDGRLGGAIDRSSGEKFKNEVLRWGGGRDPWTCLEGLMGNEEGVLAEGGERAMLEVGKWGVGAGAEGP